MRSPDKTQECSLQFKTINSSAVFFKLYFAHIFRPFVFKNCYASLLSSETLSFLTTRQTNLCSESTIENQEKGKRHVQSYQ